MKELSLTNISSHMGDEVILQSVNLSIDRGERLCLLGASGCGKTSLLRIVAGLDPHHGGKVLFRGKDIKALSPHQRNFGMMFQDFALFPHRNVFQNIAFGLEMKKQGRDHIEHRVAEMLELVGLSHHGDRRVTELSGGERQRVALARTLAPEPKLIMLDEPLGALDRLLRERLLSDLCTILDKTRMTTVLVTHDQQEAFAVADRICVMNQGRVEQIDSPVQLYNHPANRIVADFLGFQNLVETGISFPENGGVDVVHEKGVTHFILSHGVDQGMGGKKVALLFLPDGGTMVQEDGLVERNCGQTKDNTIFGFLEESFFQGSVVRIRVNTVFDLRFTFDVPARGRIPERGEYVQLAIDPESIRVIPG